jgi:methylmalonyl-CoA/ethylmalonyl-CoA epimerase
MLGQLGQIAYSVSDVDRTEAFYEQTLGLKKMYRYGDLVFFDCAGVRLMLAKPENGEAVTTQGAIYFKVPDLPAAIADLKGRNAPFIDEMHLVAPMPDHDLWMTFIRDPDGHLIGLMMEAPKGWTPPPG